MGWNVSMIIIQNPNNSRDENLLLKLLGLENFKYVEETNLDLSLLPGDESISIGYYNNCIIVCDDAQIIDNFLSDEVSEIESELMNTFPNSEILSVACISATNYHGYSLSRNQKKLRIKSLNYEDGFYYDSGEQIEEEKLIYAKSELIDGIRIWKEEELPDDYFEENQMMEDFTFGVAKRLLGVKIDNDEADELLYNTPFRKFVQ
jgi:hypothetical protein